MSEFVLGARFKAATTSSVDTWLSKNIGTALSVHWMVVAGGAGAGKVNTVGASGGGGGGYRTSFSNSTFASNSGRGSYLEPIMFLTRGTYTITIGAGGPAGVSAGNSGTNGDNSSIVTGTGTPGINIVCLGGGGGAGGDSGSSGNSGGCGGGGYAAGGAGTTAQGYDGNTGTGGSGGGGGGAGGPTTPSATTSAGAGVSSNITGTNTTRAAGGFANSSGAGGANTGNGGGTSGSTSAAGGSGVVIFRYVTAEATNAGITVSGGTATTNGVYTVVTFTSSGTLTLS